MPPTQMYCVRNDPAVNLDVYVRRFEIFETIGIVKHNKMLIINSDVVGKFIFLYLFINGCLCEPHCSKFPYEEALLEKMVRLEFKVEQMDNGFKNMEKKVSDALDELQQQRENVKGELNTIIADVKVKSDDLQGHVVGLKETVTEEINVLKKEMVKLVDENLQRNEAKLNRMSMDLQNALNSTHEDISQSTLFRARQLADLSPSNNQKLIFQIVLENNGNGYNNGTGIFTAPRSGNYLFTVQLCSHNKQDFNLAFMKDGANVQPAQFENDEYGCGTSVYITHLNATSQVWVESKGQYSGNAMFTDAYRHNVFSGILVK